jgi:hypothetical protein
MGGSTLYIESVVSERNKESGGLHITGQLGDVMKESTSLALTVAKGAPTRIPDNPHDAADRTAQQRSCWRGTSTATSLPRITFTSMCRRAPRPRWGSSRACVGVDADPQRPRNCVGWPVRGHFHDNVAALAGAGRAGEAGESGRLSRWRTRLRAKLRGCGPAQDLAMTGEITLMGRVLTIGGVREKLVRSVAARPPTLARAQHPRSDLTCCVAQVAARRSGVKEVILPKGNVSGAQQRGARRAFTALTTAAPRLADRARRPAGAHQGGAQDPLC